MSGVFIVSFQPETESDESPGTLKYHSPIDSFPAVKVLYHSERHLHGPKQRGAGVADYPLCRRGKGYPDGFHRRPGGLRRGC